MKKIRTLFAAVVCLFLSIGAFAQNSSLPEGKFQLNGGLGFSSHGVPFYAGIDYGILEDLSIGGELSYRQTTEDFVTHSAFALVANGNYHFNRLLEVPEELDVYAGLSLGYFSWSPDNNFMSTYNSGLRIYIQTGGRYFFNEQWGANIQFEAGGITAFKFGVTYRF